MNKPLVSLALVFALISLATFASEPAAATHVDCLYRQGVPVSDELLPQTKLKSEALMWFRLAEERQKEGNVSSELCYGIAYATQAKVSLKSLGTSQRQLALVQKAGWHNQAMMWLRLARARSNGENVTYYINYVKENATLSSSSLESLGTSESELTALQVKGYRSEALVMIHISRKRAKNKEETDRFIGYAKDSAKQAGEDFEKLNKLPTSSLPPLPSLAKHINHRRIGGNQILSFYR